MTTAQDNFPSIETRRFFTVTEAARLLGISVPGLHVWIKKGRIRRLSRTSETGTYRIPRGELVRLLRCAGREVMGLWTPKRLRVLLIEDDPGVRALVGEAFRDSRLKVEVETALTPEDGLLLAGKSKPDVILLDSFRPKDGMTADQALRILRRARSLESSRIVGLYHERPCPRGVSAPRADAYLPKPFSVTELREVVLGRGARDLAPGGADPEPDRRLWEYRVQHGSTRPPSFTL